MSPAMRPACAVNWPMSGSVAPGHRSGPAAAASATCRRTSGSSVRFSRATTSTPQSPNSVVDEMIATGAGGNVQRPPTRKLTTTQCSPSSSTLSTRPIRTPRNRTGFPV